MSTRTKNQLLTELDNQAEMMITDRTVQDAKDLLAILSKMYVERSGSYVGPGEMTPEEREIVTHPHKGAYNYTDLDRVSIYCNALVEVMSRFYGTYTPGFTSMPEEWENIMDPTQLQLVNYIGSICAVRDKWNPELGIQNLLNIDEIYAGISFDTANNIEKTLLAIHEVVNKYIFGLDSRYCGQFYGPDSGYTIPCGMALYNDSAQNGLWAGLDRGG